jgi:hypothetical protein
MNWIKVSDKMPKKNEVVLLYGRLTGIITGWYDEPKGQWNTGGKFNLMLDLCTHWMCLPETPKE